MATGRARTLDINKQSGQPKLKATVDAFIVSDGKGRRGAQYVRTGKEDNFRTQSLLTVTFAYLPADWHSCIQT